MKIDFHSDASGQVLGRMPGSGRIVNLEWKSGHITRIAPAAETEENPRWLMPSLFDLQVNGYGGIDFQDPSVSAEDLERSVDLLKRHGCGGCLVTLISDEWESMLEKLRRLVRFRSTNPNLTSFIRGWHLEGPFLSSEKGFRGAHRAEVMRNPDSNVVGELRAIVPEDTLLLTIAPERKGATELIRRCREAGIQVSLGHSAASAREVETAVAAGARGVTHFGNGCPQLWERHDNWFWTVVDCRGLYVGLIPDGIHLPDRVFRGMHRALAERHEIYYTTDSMAAAGAGVGRFPLAGQMLEVGEDQVVRQPGQPNFAGSALRPLDGILRAQRMLGEDWKTLWRRFSEVPAEFLGLNLALRVGVPACFSRIEEDGSGQIVSVDLHSASLS